MSVESLDPSLAPVVTRWCRYGHDRAYVAAGGRELGYRDLRSGDVTCAATGDAPAVAAATDELWRRCVEQRRAVAYVPRHGRTDDGMPSAFPAAVVAPIVVPPAQVVAPISVPPAAGAASAPEPTSADPTVAASPVMVERDLAANRPGDAARARARELLAEAPVRLRLLRVAGVKTDERNWRVGAAGEARSGRALERLGDMWRVLHAVPVGTRGSDIDHVVIGPGGVFTVNAKNHPGARVWCRGDTVKVNGANQFYVRNSRHEAERAGALLSAAAGLEVRARGVVAITGATAVTIKELPTDVRVLPLGVLPGWLKEQPVVLDEAAVERIFDAARRPATWQRTHPARAGRSPSRRA